MSSPVDQLNAIIAFRSTNEAPVDTMGASQVGDKDDPKLYRFQTLIGLMLSAQTRDEITSKAVLNLRTSLPGGLTPSVLAQADATEIAGLIRLVSFAKTKSTRVIEVAKICDRDYDGDIPRTLEDLMALPGVGLKMATLAMLHAWNEEIGIGVDVHVHRISNRLGWVDTRQPDKTEAALQNVFPRELWLPVNETLVGFGQTICAAKRPKCADCPVRESCAWHAENGDPPPPKGKGKKKKEKEKEKEKESTDDDYSAQDSL
jgi:endonuclease-3